MGALPFLLQNFKWADFKNQLQKLDELFAAWVQETIIPVSADIDPHIIRIYIANCQPDAFPKAQPNAVDDKEKDLVAQPVRCGNELVNLRY